MIGCSKLLLAAALSLGSLPAVCDGAQLQMVATSSSQAQMQMELHEARVVHQDRMKSLSSRMTVGDAVKVLQKKTPTHPKLNTVLNLLKDKSSKKQNSRLRAVAAQSAFADPAGAQKANILLRDMIIEVQAKYDKKLDSCCAFSEKQNALMEDAKNDVATFNAEAAEGRREILDANAQITICETEIETDKTDLGIETKKVC